MQDCSTEPLAIFCFSFLAVNVLPSGNQQTDLTSTGWLSTGTETVPANEKTPERQTVFIPSFSCTVDCIRIQCMHVYSVTGQ